MIGLINIDVGDINADWIKWSRRMSAGSQNKAVRLAIMTLAKLYGRELSVADYMEMFTVDRSQFTRDQPDVAQVAQEIQALWNSAGMTSYRKVPITYSSSDRTVFSCSCCGAQWWDGYTETLRLAEYQAEPDVNGDHYPIVGKFDVIGRAEWHLPSCPLSAEAAQ